MKAPLKLHVQAKCRNEDGPPVAFVARMIDKLKTEGRMESAPGVQRVIGLENVFATVVEAAIAQEKA